MKSLTARNQKGFTLVELVIVIALLAALALGILAALDPLEQIRKGNDTTKRDIASQFYTASVRYYAIKEKMPWCPAAGACPALATTALSGLGTTIQNLKDYGELKASFDQVYSTQLPVIFATGTTTAITVCYQPQSKQFKSDPLSRYTDSSGATSTCTPGPTATCWWCAK